jgi:hypothetical protein
VFVLFFVSCWSLDVMILIMERKIWAAGEHIYTFFVFVQHTNCDTDVYVNSVFDTGISVWICTAYNVPRKKMDVTRKRPLATVATLTVIVITSDMVSQRLGIFQVFHSLGPLVW